MPRFLITALVTLTFLLITIMPSSGAPLQAPAPYEVIAAVNALRASHGLPPYAADPILMAAAQTQADYLASTPNFRYGHIGPGGTDADARAIALGFPYVQGLDINENWGTLREGQPIETLIFGGWSDDLHMHTMLHDRGQLVGAGVAISGDTAFIILDVAAYWGDAGMQTQPTSASYGDAASGQGISQYIAPVQTALPAPDGSLTHTVMSGQSLWIIAHHYGVDIERLRQLNPLVSGDIITIGQKILIQPPQPASIAAATAAAATASAAPAQITLAPAAPTAMPTTTLQQPAPGSPTPRAETPAPSQNSNLLFLLFFTLLGAGIILIVLSQTNRS